MTGHSQIDREVGLGNGGRGGRGENELKKEGGVGLKEEVSGLQTNRSEEGKGEREGGREERENKEGVSDVSAAASCAYLGSEV